MDENFHFVEKRSNPQNISKARPKENFWSCEDKIEGGWYAILRSIFMVGYIYERGWQAIIQSLLKKFDLNFFLNLMGSVKTARHSRL